jgi:DNA-binding beta-propeller fold protein YncE
MVMNQSGNKLRYLFVIVIFLAAMILGIPSRASAYVLKTIEETRHLNYIDVAVDSDGNLYTFTDNNHIVKMDPDGNILYDFGSLYDPQLLTVDPSGNVIIITTNENNNALGDIVKFAKTSTGYSLDSQKSMFVDVYPGLRELTTDSNGNLYLIIRSYI